MVEMQYVQSSHVECIGYDADAMELHVRFLKNAALYVYLGVPQTLYEQMLNAASVGEFLNAEIKNVYPFDRR